MRRLLKSKLNLLGVLLVGAVIVAGCSSTKNNTVASHSSGKVLLVGTYHGRKGQFTSIQAAVNAAKPGDWILIAPGDYHENANTTNPTASQIANGELGGIVITTPNLHVRGMNRNSTIIDGTNPGSSQPCTSNPALQNLGPANPSGGNYGRNGITVYKANNTWIENLTVCNFLNGSGSQTGYEIWWDGGAGTGKIGLHGYWGSYLTATSTYYGPVSVDATYGIFASTSAGPASWKQIYASNFNDRRMYIGACQQVCDITVDHAWMEYNALGYSGTNSGGAVVVEHSQFDNNQDGFDTNTQIAGDPPPPQNGDCPGNKISPITHTRSCWVFMDNYVHNNNNPYVPQAPGYASAGPTGTGMTISGGRNDTIMNNTFANNGAWGVLFVPFPDGDTPFPGVTCANSGGVEHNGFGCVYDPEGDLLLNNTFIHNGFFGNPSNADYGRITLDPGQPQNCFVGNKAPDGSSPANLEKIESKCGPLTTSAHTGGSLLAQVLCDTGFGSCPAGSKYPTNPKGGPVTMKPLPKNLPTMPNPCKGVPSNPWCPS